MSMVIWTLTDIEKNEIQELFEKKIALENIVNIIDASNIELYNKVTTDYGKVLRVFQNWFNEKSQKYSWPQGEKWSINFETNEVTVE